MQRRWPMLAAALAGTLVAAGTAWGANLAIDTEGHTTLERILAPHGDPDAGYATLEVEDVGDSYLVRDGAREGDDAVPDAQAGREGRRRSLAYFSQMTGYQLVDEESPARVEFRLPARHGARGRR